MGVSPYDKLSHCVTCGSENLECPGHFGHIELMLPVYNPFLIDRLLKLLRSKCFHCHKFRISKEKAKCFEVCFTLIKLGYVEEAKRYKEIFDSKVLRTKKLQKTKVSTDLSEMTSRKASDSTVMIKESE